MNTKIVLSREEVLRFLNLRVKERASVQQEIKYTFVCLYFVEGVVLYAAQNTIGTVT
jgi:hypothetical protein